MNVQSVSANVVSSPQGMEVVLMILAGVAIVLGWMILGEVIIRSLSREDYSDDPMRQS